MHGPEGSTSSSIGLRTLVAILILLGGLVMVTMKCGNQSNPTIGNSSNSSIIILATPIPQREEPVQPSPAPSPTTAKYIVVYITGNVRKPDTYQLLTGSRIKDAVVAAGGMTEQADASRVNLADYLYDTQHIHIPAVGETAIPSTSSSDSRPASPSGESSSSSTTSLNINTANQSQLEELEGIGKVLAERIIAYRETNGPFTTVEDLQNVQGISPALVEKIKNTITVGP